MSDEAPTSIEQRDLVVIGGGAAGLAATLFAARAGAHPLLLEGSRACGIKILVSGGGRCNVLPSQVDNSDFFTRGSRHVLRRLFRTWPLPAVREFFEQDLGIPLVLEEDSGKLFPADQSARTVRGGLVDAVLQAGGEIRVGSRVVAVGSGKVGLDVALEPARGAPRIVTARRVVIATGGQSLPRTGSDGAGYAMARALGHSVLPTYPALVPLTSRDTELRELAGISLPVRWRARDAAGRTLEERVRELLFTHKGFSGPAILDASHWSARDGAAIEIGWGDVSQERWQRLLAVPTRRTVVKTVAELLPRRLARILCARAGINETFHLAHLPRDRRRALLDQLVRFPLRVDGNLGFRVAEVTGGGVPLDEVEPATLASRATPGLYLCGEILDVIGRIGGYNFLWAWVTGRLAGESAARGFR